MAAIRSMDALFCPHGFAVNADCVCHACTPPPPGPYFFRELPDTEYYVMNCRGVYTIHPITRTKEASRPVYLTVFGGLQAGDTDGVL